MVDNEKVYKLLKHVPTENITDMNALIYVGAKLVGDKIGIPQRNPNWNTKPTCEMRIEGQIKKLQ